MLRVQLFGEVRAWRGAEPLQLGPAQQRAVFAMLALADGQPVPRDLLISTLWGDDPPLHAVNVIQVYVLRLRRSLDPDRTTRAPSKVLARSGDSYLLRLAADQVDVLRFRQLTAAARDANRSGDHGTCFTAAEEALRLWRATPAADLPMLAGHPLISVLSDERWALVAWFADAALRRDTPGDALAAVEEAVAARSLDEPLHGWLIQLYAALGRWADALGCYERLRRRLVDELGVDPTPQLRALHQAVLRDEDPRPVPTPAVPRPAGPSHPVPRQLPAPPQLFTGRATELADVDRVDDASTVVITAIDGMPGWERPHWPCRPRTRWSTAIPTGSCSSICTATPTVWRRWSPVRRWTGYCGRSESPASGSRPTPTSGRRCTAAGWPTSVY